MRTATIKPIKKLNYKKLITKKIIIGDVIDKLNEIIEVINKLSKQKPKTNNLICPKCKSTDTIKRGLRYNLGRGKVQKWGCKKCKARFMDSGLDFRMRNHEFKIKKAIELFNQDNPSLSYQQIADKIGGVTRQTIHRWIHKYNILKEDKVIEREQKNQYGTYTRKYKIKYKKKPKKNASTKR